MFRLLQKIMQWLGKPAQPNVEQPDVVELSGEPEIVEQHKEVVELSGKPVIEEVPVSNFDKQTTEKLKVREAYPKSAIASLQEQLNSFHQGKLSLWPPGKEYIGPVVINRPLILDGQGATICSQYGPVVSIQADRVSLRNLRIEVTAEEGNTPVEKCALLVKSGQGLQLDDVEVRGSVMGLPEEEGEWKYPESLHLGQLAHGREHDLLLRIVVPVNCKIAANISGLDFAPGHLTPGPNEVRLHIDSLPKDTLINGSIFLVSASLKRRITLTAHILSLQDSQVSPSQNSIVWQPEDWLSFITVPQPQPSEAEFITIESSQSPPPQPSNDVEGSPNQTLHHSPRACFQTSQLNSAPPQPPLPPPNPPLVRGDVRNGGENSVKVSLSQEGLPEVTNAQDKGQQSQLFPLRQPKIRRGEQPNDVLFTSELTGKLDEGDVNNTSEVAKSPISFVFVQSQNDVQSQPIEPLSIPDKEYQLGSAFSLPNQQSKNQQTVSSQEPILENVSDSSEPVRSQPINPLFNSTSTPSQPSDESKQGRKQEATPNTASPSGLGSAKRKIVRSKDISPLFGDGSKKQQPDEQP